MVNGREKGMKKKNPGNVISVAAIILLLLVIIVCTLFGNRIYEWCTPEISVKKVSMYRMDGINYLKIPKTALTKQDEICVVTSKEGFSRTIYQAYIYRVDYTWEEDEPLDVYVSTALPRNCFVATDAGEISKLKDGDQVIIKR